MHQPTAGVVYFLSKYAHKFHLVFLVAVFRGVWIGEYGLFPYTLMAVAKFTALKTDAPILRYAAMTRKALALSRMLLVVLAFI